MVFNVLIWWRRDDWAQYLVLILKNGEFSNKSFHGFESRTIKYPIEMGKCLLSPHKISRIILYFVWHLFDSKENADFIWATLEDYSLFNSFLYLVVYDSQFFCPIYWSTVTTFFSISSLKLLLVQPIRYSLLLDSQIFFSLLCVSCFDLPPHLSVALIFKPKELFFYCFLFGFSPCCVSHNQPHYKQHLWYVRRCVRCTSFRCSFSVFCVLIVSV